MAEKGAWAVLAAISQEGQTLFLGSAPGPLVVYRVHNDGPGDILVSVSGFGFRPATVRIRAGADSDLSGSDIEITFSGRQGSKIQSGSGTYELLCCQAPVPPATVAAASQRVSTSPQSKTGGAARARRDRLAELSNGFPNSVL